MFEDRILIYIKINKYFLKCTDGKTECSKQADSIEAYRGLVRPRELRGKKHRTRVPVQTLADAHPCPWHSRVFSFCLDKDEAAPHPCAGKVSFQALARV